MQKTRKDYRALAILLTLVMVFAMIPITASAAAYGNVTFSIPSGENLSISTPTQSGNTFTYSVVSSITGYNPYNFSLNIVPDSGTTITVTGQGGAEVTQDGTLAGNTTYWLVTPSTAQASSVQVTDGTYTYIVSCSIPSGAPSAGAGAYAYLPAPGQFTNEGINTGGWGDIYNSGSASLKGMVNAMSSTGVSLGYFGGYVVFDMGTDISNDADNPYGVDFIVYGNAFKNNSEPGCIQVAPDADGDGSPDAWYDIAGSLHYNSSTVWNASYTYTNPFPSDDFTSTYPTTGTWSSTVASNSVPFTYTPGSGSGAVAANTFHRHSYFPLYANYFVGRGSNAAMAKTSSLPFATYSRTLNAAGTDVANTTLTLTGVKLGSATNTQTANYTFGYADVHPNTGTAGEAANPYAATADTTGGDGIDISWAVNSNGEPVNLSSIRFVRVYTGAAATNGIFGEISTEVCGIYAASGTGSGETTTVNGTTLSVTDVNSPTLASSITSANTFNVASDEEITVSFSYDNSTTNTVFVNGNSGTGSASLTLTLEDGEEQIVRVIAKDTTTGNPYIGYMKLVGALQ